MLEIIIAFLGASLLFYVLFGGADFGAGIVELFSARRASTVTTSAIGPVWEANHMWLILAVVILFMAFPAAYTLISTALHIPLVLMLAGIILRGTAFTFRHYDAIHDNSEKYYSLIFRISSVITSLFLGIIVGALMLGKIRPGAGNFYDAYLAPWLNSFSLAMGLFTCCLFAFLASVYLIGETKDLELRRSFERHAWIANIAVVISGILVFISAQVEGLPLLLMFLSSWFTLACVALATLSLPFLWKSLRSGNALASRLIAGAQVLFIMTGWFRIQFPSIVRFRQGAELTFYNAAAPDATLRQLGLALLIGSALIFPALYYLFRVFKFEPDSKPREL